MQYYFTNNTKLAAALATLGFPMRNPDPVTNITRDGKKTFTYWFQATSADGKYRAKSKDGSGIVDAWFNREQFEKDFPEHPLNYVRACLENRERLLDLINGAPPMVLLERDGYSIFLHKNADPKLISELQSRI